MAINKAPCRGQAMTILCILLLLTGCGKGNEHNPDSPPTSAAVSEVPDEQKDPKEFWSRQMAEASSYFSGSESIRGSFHPLKYTEYAQWDTEIPLTLIHTLEANLYEGRIDEFLTSDAFWGASREKIEAVCPSFQKLAKRSLDGYTPDSLQEAVYLADTDSDGEEEILFIEKTESTVPCLVVLNQNVPGVWERAAELTLWEDNVLGGICLYENKIFAIADKGPEVSLQCLCYASSEKASDEKDGRIGPEEITGYSMELVTIGTTIEEMERNVIYEDNGFEGREDLSRYIDRNMTDILIYSNVGFPISTGIKDAASQEDFDQVKKQFSMAHPMRVDYDNDGIRELVVDGVYVNERYGDYILNAAGESLLYSEGMELIGLPDYPLEDALFIPTGGTPMFPWETTLKDTLNRTVWFEEIGGQVYLFRIYMLDSYRHYDLSNRLFIAGKVENGTFRYLNISAFAPSTGVFSAPGPVNPVKSSVESKFGDSLTLLNEASAKRAIKTALTSASDVTAADVTAADETKGNMTYAGMTGPEDLPEGLYKLAAKALLSGEILETLAPYMVSQNLLAGELKQLVPIEDIEEGRFDDTFAGYLLDFDKDKEAELLSAIWYTDDRAAYKHSEDKWTLIFQENWRDKYGKEYVSSPNGLQPQSFVVQYDGEYYWMDYGLVLEQLLLNMYHWNRDGSISNYQLGVLNGDYQLIPAYSADQLTTEEGKLLDRYVEGMYEELMETAGRGTTPKLYKKGYTEDLSRDESIKGRFLGYYAEDITKADFNNDGSPEFVCIKNADPYVSENLQWGETRDPKMSMDIWRISGDSIEGFSDGWTLLPHGVMDDIVNLWFYKEGENVYTCVLTGGKNGAYGLSILRFDGSIGTVVKSYGIWAEPVFRAIP